MKKLKDDIEIQAYLELMISCQIEECVEDFSESLEHPARDPVEEWAVEMARKARLIGWTSDKEGRVVCPKHSN